MEGRAYSRGSRTSLSVASVAAVALVVSAFVIATASSSAEAGDQPKILRAGSSIGGASSDEGLRSCTVTVPGRRISDGKPQLLTSGWCGDRSITGSDRFTLIERSSAGGSAIASGTGDLGSKAIGTSLWEPDGIGLVDLTASDASTLPETITWGLSSGAPLASAPIKIRDVVAPKVGDPICKSSDITGWTCAQLAAKRERRGWWAHPWSVC